MSRLPRYFVYLAALALVAAACNSSDAAAPEDTTSTTTSASGPTTTGGDSSTTRPPGTTWPGGPSTSTTTLPIGPPSPLNGIPVADETLLARRVMAVKMDNHPNARPQSGVNEADAVYELLVEGGHSRFILLFHHTDTDYVGPIRSGRPTDPGLVKPLGAPLVLSGAQSWVFGVFQSRGVDAIGEIGTGTFRVSSRSAPHNLYGNTVELRGVADGRGYPDDPPPSPMFEFGTWSGSTPATHLELEFSSGNIVSWDWDGVRWVRAVNGEAHEWVDQEGNVGVIAADTLVVLFAERYTACPSGVKGSCVPALDTLDTRTAWVLARGQIIEGTWHRADIEDMFTLEDANGGPIVLPPGIPWIHVFPDGNEVTWE